MTGYANRQSDEVESLVPVGSTPISVTDPVVQRRRHLGDIQKSDGSIPSGITAKHGLHVLWLHAALVKAEDWVQFPDGPLKKWAARPTGRCLACNQEIGVRFPGRSTEHDGLMVQRDDTALAWRKSEFDSRWVH
jgi:hypothetical protein